MDWGYVALISITVTLLIIMVQRAEKKRRRLVASFALLCLLVIRHNAFLKGNLHEETLAALLIGALLSGIFWLLIGRYNPVGTADEIRVMGLDD